MKACVTISLVPESRGGPFVFWDDLQAACRDAAEIGFPAVEIFPPSPDSLPTSSIQTLLNAYDLKLAAVGTGAGWLKHGLTLTDVSAEKRRAAINFIRSIIDQAGSLGAPAIIGSMQGRHSAAVDAGTATGYLIEALAELGEHALQYGVPLLYEPLNRYETNLCTTLLAGGSLLNQVAASNVRLLVDLFHMNIEEVNLAESIRQAGQLIGHVHFVDSNRRAAGYGHTPFAPIGRALRAIGYEGYLSAEAFAWPDSLTAAKQTMTAFVQLQQDSQSG